DGSVQVSFDLMFRRNIDNIGILIPNVIYNGANRVILSGTDLEISFISGYIVDIRTLTGSVIITPKPPLQVGVLAKLTIVVYNLTYSSDLMNSNSYQFRSLAVPFCADIERIFLISELTYRYYSCNVDRFGANPDVVVTNIFFTGQDTISIQSNIKRIVMDNAQLVLVGNRYRKIIGTLIITPDNGGDGGGVVDVIVTPYPPSTSTISPTPTMTSM
ncbi:hypothetical protein ACJMK2_019213, partial [Sinanodonta woodiana]